MIYTNLINVFDKLLYGCIHDICFMKCMFCIINYSLAIIFYKRIKHQRGVFKGIICTSTLTLGIYQIVPESAGISTVWSFYYGIMEKKYFLDHIMYWIPCISVIIPWSMHNIVYSLYKFRLWPYDSNYIYI
jgi:hypothetical protein